MKQVNKYFQYDTLLHSALNISDDKKSALKLIDQAIKMNPHFYRAYHYRCIINEEHKEWEQGLIDHDLFLDKKGILENKNGFDGGYRYRLDNSSSVVDDLIKSKPQVAQNYYIRGCYRMGKEDWGAAFEDLRVCIKKDPNHALAFCRMGEVKLKQENISGGVRDLKKSISLDPSNTHPYYHLGMHYLSINKEAEAVKLFKKAVEINEYAWPIYQELGDIYMKRKDNKSAIECYTEAIKINPVNSDLYQKRSKCFKHIGQIENAAKDQEMIKLIDLETKHIKSFTRPTHL